MWWPMRLCNLKSRQKPTGFGNEEASSVASPCRLMEKGQPMATGGPHGGVSRGSIENSWLTCSFHCQAKKKKCKNYFQKKKKKRRRKRRQWFSPKCQRSKEKMILSFLDGGTCLTLVKSPRPSHHFLSLLASYFFFYFSFISWQWFYIYIYIYMCVCVCVCIVPSSLGTSCRRH